MTPVPPRGPALQSLLADLGTQVQRGDRAPESLPPLPTGLCAIDRMLGGGLPRGRLCEISGALSSGRTSLALALLAHVTASGECAAVVDRADAFDPASARAAGVVLDRVLWTRPPDEREALRCTERLLEADGFPLVLLDHRPDSADSIAVGRAPSRKEPGTTAFLRLSRKAAATRSTLLLLGAERRAGALAEVALELQPARVRFSGSPALLDRLEVRVQLVRHRSAPDGTEAALSLRTRPEAA